MQMAIAAAWLPGAADLIAYVAEAGGGKGIAAVVLFGPFLLVAKPLGAVIGAATPEWRQWAITLLMMVAALPSLIALICVQVSYGDWIHPSWF